MAQRKMSVNFSRLRINGCGGMWGVVCGDPQPRANYNDFIGPRPKRWCRKRKEHELQSKLAVSPLMTPVILLDIPPFKEFRPQTLDPKP